MPDKILSTPQNLQVLYEDNHLIIVNKRPGDIVQGDKTGDMPLSEVVKEYIKVKYNKPGNVYLGVVHRLDRPTSGIVLFARTSKALPRLNQLFKDKEAKKEFGSDQYLGDYLTKGDYVELYCRDHEFVDGDKVNIYLNGIIIQRSVSLTAGYRPILVSLKTGFNTIEFEAINQGTSGPNTAELILFDDKGQTLAHKEWNLLTGAKARIVVVKN